MRNVGVLVCILGTTFSLAACNTGSSDAYEAGTNNCSYQFVNDFNRVADAVRYSLTNSDLDSAQSLVNDFNNKYQNVSCQAALDDDRHLDTSSTSIDANAKVTDWNTKISKKRKLLNPPPVSEPTVTAPPTSPNTLSTAITLDILHSREINNYANTGRSLNIQNGRATSNSDLDRYSDYCFLEMLSGTANFHDGDQMTLIIHATSTRLSAVSPSGKMELSCVKASGSYSWTLSDLDQIFTGIALFTR